MSSKKKKRSNKKRSNVSKRSQQIREQLQLKPQAPKLETILLEIPGYCDPQLMNTVNSALLQADHPERVHLAICHQDDNMTDYFTLKKYKNCKVKHLSTAESKGLCYARNICQQMLEDEDFVMHTDSHMRFIKHWDTLIIEQWKSFNDPKAIISAYPPNCNTKDMMSYPLDHEAFSKPGNGAFMHAMEFMDMETCYVRFCARNITKDNHQEMIGKLNPFMSGGYFFAPAQVDRDIPSDPKMFFLADEISVAARLYTHGYNLRNPGECYAYHEYQRANRKFPTHIRKEDSELQRVLTMFDMVPESEKVDLGEFGLGSERTLDDYIEFCGIDFRNKIIYESAERGIFDEPKYKTAISPTQKRYNRKYDFVRNSKITVIVTSNAEHITDMTKLMSNCIKTAINKKNINFIFSMSNAKLWYQIKNKTFGYNVKFTSPLNKRYGALLEHGVKEALNMHKADYVLCIDDSVRFIDAWDTNMLSYLYDVGLNNVLTTWCYTYGTKRPLSEAIPYINKITYATGMNWPYPVCGKYNFTSTGRAETAYLLSESNIMFCKLDTLASVPLDPKFGFRATNYVYSMMLWTYGHTVYYPYTSYLVRLSDPPANDINIPEQAIIRYLMRSVDDTTRYMDYKYEPGEQRTVEQWLVEMGIDYATRKFTKQNR